MPKGTCKIHGEFELADGCAKCLAKVTGESIEPVAETAIVLRPGEDLEAHGYYEESMKLLKYAEGRVISNVEQNKQANDDLSIISKLKRAMDGKRKSLFEPLKAEIETIRATYDYLMLPILEADKLTRNKMLAFDVEQRRIRAEQEEINRLREEATQKQKELTGEIEDVEIVEVAPEVAKRVDTDMGSTGVVDHWKYEVFDFALLPDEYKLADTAMLNSIAKKHHDKKAVAGVRFYNEPIISNRAR